MEITVGLFDNGIPIVSDSPHTSIKIRRVSDGFLYDWDDATFKDSGWTQLAQQLLEIDLANLPGYYQRIVSESLWNDGYYQVFISYFGTINLSGSLEKYVKDGEVFEEEVTNKLETAEQMQERILGLIHENIFIDQTVYDTDGNLTSARVRIYSNSADVGTNIGVIATYEASTLTEGPGKFTTWQQVKI
jgi:hypothetical protein